MTLRKKTLLIIGVVLVGLVAALYILSQVILMDGYLHLEERNTQRNLERALNALDNEISIIHTMTIDWAHWDDSYSFAQDANEAYITSNLSDTTFIANSLNAAVFINSTGQLVYAKAFDLENEQEIPVSPGLQTSGSESAFALDLAQIITETGIDGRSGILLLPEGPMLFAAVPIVRSDLSGTPPGMLVFGRYLNGSRIADLADKSRLSLDVYRLDTLQLPDDIQAVRSDLSPANPVAIRSLSKTTIAGYALIDDVYGKPILMLRIDMPRDIYAQGKTSLAYFLGAMLLVGVVFALLTLLILEKIVLSRLANLSASVAHISTTSDLATPIVVSGHDELADLAQGIKAMLAALAQSQTRLQEAHDELEKRVVERTAELSVANSRLTQEVAERQQAQAQLAQAHDQAIKALRLKTQILANVSHDARTPLNVITLRTETLQRGYYGEISEKQKKALELILVSARQLVGFFDNLLGEAQLDGKKMKLALVEFSPGKLLQDVTDVMLPLAERKGLQLKTELDTGLPPTLRGDPERLQQVLSNLVDNAIKFTPHGSVTVHVCRAEDGQWALKVSDTGVGIPPEAQARIFEAFWQVDGSTTRQANRGVGLGLSIVRQLVNLMGGQVAVDSKVGIGSTFTVLLPLLETEVELSHV